MWTFQALGIGSPSGRAVWKAILWSGNDSLNGSVVVEERRKEVNYEEYGVRIEWIGVY
jgi:hypothetical protein